MTKYLAGRHIFPFCYRLIIKISISSLITIINLKISSAYPPPKKNLIILLPTNLLHNPPHTPPLQHRPVRFGPILHKIPGLLLHQPLQLLHTPHCHYRLPLKGAAFHTGHTPGSHGARIPDSEPPTGTPRFLRTDLR